MKRKKTNLIDDIFEFTGMLPWWGGLIMAGMVWLIGIIITKGEHSQLQESILPIIKFVFNGLAFVVLVATGGSSIRSAARRRLLDKQQDIESIRDLSWQQFEQLVGEAYRRQGYLVSETGGGGADGGVDIILESNSEKILVQCKRWKTQSVGVDKVRELFGVMTAENAAGCILVSTGNFTNAAKSFAEGKPIELVNGDKLAKLVHNAKTTSLVEYAVPENPASTQVPICPKCGRAMVLRTAKKGQNAGSQFYGCSQFPKCRGIRSI